jgi:hypothetical protein
VLTGSIVHDLWTSLERELDRLKSLGNMDTSGILAGIQRGVQDRDGRQEFIEGQCILLSQSNRKSIRASDMYIRRNARH